MGKSTQAVGRRQFLRTGVVGAMGVGLAASAASHSGLAQASVSSDILASLSYNPDPNPFPFVSGLAWTGIPAARVTFSAPASGQVLVGTAAAVRTTVGGAQGYWQFVDAAGTPVAGSEQLVTVLPSTVRVSSRILIDGLNPGSVQTWTLQQKTAAGQIQLFAGRGRIEVPGYGPLTIVVIAA